MQVQSRRARWFSRHRDETIANFQAITGVDDVIQWVGSCRRDDALAT
jgi:hypothetical protein